MSIYLYGLYAGLAFALCGWLLSFATRHYSHVDSMWSLFMLVTAYTTALFVIDLSFRGLLVLVAVTVWALRLSIFITWRNWGKEDYRYDTIRKNNEPYFWFKSIYIVFGLQAGLAWLIAYPLFVAISSSQPLSILDGLAALLFITGLYWEVVADYQLAIFKANPAHASAVLSTGLWRYSRHPNYFGESLIWWAFGLAGVAAGSGWALGSAALMTLLLLKVSGVSLLEQTIHSRRPAYTAYMANTNAFIPCLPRQTAPAADESAE